MRRHLVLNPKPKAADSQRAEEEDLHHRKENLNVYLKGKHEMANGTCTRLVHRIQDDHATATSLRSTADSEP